MEGCDVLEDEIVVVKQQQHPPPHHHHQQQQQQQQQQQHHLQNQPHNHHQQHHQHHHHHRQQQHQIPHQHHHRHPQQHTQQQGSEDDSKLRTTVLVAMDGSPHSFYAFDWYMAYMHKPHNDVIVVHSSPASINLLSCSEPLLPSVRDTPSPILSRLVSKEEEEVNRIAQQIKGKLTATGVRGKLVRLSGEPGPAIVELANQHGADCIVTGSRGMGTIRRALIGSVSDYILHHSTCPVLVCRYKEGSNG